MVARAARAHAAAARCTDYGGSCAAARRSPAGRCSTRSCCATGCTPSPPAANGSRRRPTPVARAGVPLKLVRSLDGIVFEQACIDRLVVAARPASAHRAHRGAARRQPAGSAHAALPDGVSANGGRSRIFCARAVSPQEHRTHRRFAREVRAATAVRVSERARVAVPAAARARPHAEGCRRCSRPRRCSSPRPGTLAQEVLGCRIADYYGQAERIAFAYAFAPREYRFLPGYSHVEFLPYESKLLPAGGRERLYEVVGTSFWNNLMPLVRYRTGDLIRLPAAWGARELEELGCGMRSFRGILGREQEIIACPTGVRVTGLDSIPDDVEHVLRIQVVQETLDSALHPRRARARLQRGRCRAACCAMRAPSVPADMRLRVEVAQLARAHTARQDAAGRASAAGSRGTAARRRRTAARRIESSAKILACSNLVGICDACGACPAPRWPIVSRAACAPCRRRSRCTSCRRATRSPRTCASCRRSSRSRPTRCSPRRSACSRAATRSSTSRTAISAIRRSGIAIR